MDHRYAGWRALVDSIQAGSARHGITVHVKPKNGYLAIEVPASAPDDLQSLADKIESIFDKICQLCGAPHAKEFNATETGWILKLCDPCRSARTQSTPVV